jgi:nuclear transport factor 2 (NTF2) superfamily protein
MQKSLLADFAERYTAAWCSQNAASVAAFYSIDGSLSVNGGVPALGRNAITEFAQSFMTAFPDLRVVLNQVVVSRDRAEYHWTLTGTNTGPQGTGHAVRISGFENWQFGTDGLIAFSQGHFDSNDYDLQLQGSVR